MNVTIKNVSDYDNRGYLLVGICCGELKRMSWFVFSALSAHMPIRVWFALLRAKANMLAGDTEFGQG